MCFKSRVTEEIVVHQVDSAAGPGRFAERTSPVLPRLAGKGKHSRTLGADWTVQHSAHA